MDNPIIKHLVLTGGGTAAIVIYAILRESNKENIWNINNIESIYGTSAGAITAFCISLKYDWEEIDNYLLNRPWENVYKMGIDNIINCFHSKGIFGKRIFEEMLHPLLKGKDLEPSITMKELYEYSNISLHIFTTESHNYESVDISHKTHPDWKVIDAIYCSACVPVMFIPFLKDEHCYTDGGITNNYPIYECLESARSPSEIFGIKLSEQCDARITENSSLIDFLLLLLAKIREKAYLERLHSVKKDYTIKHEITLELDNSKIFDVVNVMKSKTEIENMIHYGVELWNRYAKTIV